MSMSGNRRNRQEHVVANQRVLRFRIRTSDICERTEHGGTERCGGIFQSWTTLRSELDGLLNPAEP